MSEAIGYIGARYPEGGEIHTLYRFRETGDASYSEWLLPDGTWANDNRLLDVALNLHNPVYVELSEAEAAPIIERLARRAPARVAA